MASDSNRPAQEVSPESSGDSPPSADAVISNVTGEANASIASYLDQSCKKPASKQKGVEKRSDAVKIECVFGRLDVLKELQSLLRTTHSYLSHVSDSGTSRVVQPAISSLEFAVEQHRVQLEGLAKDLNNTASLKHAQLSHNKRNKRARQLAADHAIQMTRLMKDQPAKAMQMSLKIAKEKVNSMLSKADCSVKSGKRPAESVAVSLPRTKKAKGDEVIGIRLPRPQNGQLMYAPQECANILYELLLKPDPKPGRKYADRVKQKMIDDRLVPVGRTQLNNILRKHGAPGTPMANLTWNSSGRPEILDYEVLKQAYNDNDRVGKGWSFDNTKDTLKKAMKDRLAGQNMDISIIKSPAKSTILSYHSSIMSDPSLTNRKVDAKTVYREAAETSQRSMLTDACGILCTRAFVAPTKSGIPLELRYGDRDDDRGRGQRRRIN